MYKRFAVSAALLLLLSFAASASAVLQSQDFGLGQTNYVGVLGDGAAGNINVTTAAMDQLVTDVCCHSTGYQSTVGSLMQAAGAVGMCSGLDVLQIGTASGSQDQIPGTDAQVQNLGAQLWQEVNKAPMGSGSALGLQTFIGIQTQLSFNPWGGSANVQGIGVSLYDAVGGGPGGLTNVGGSASFGAGQY